VFSSFPSRKDGPSGREGVKPLSVLRLGKVTPEAPERKKSFRLKEKSVSGAGDKENSWAKNRFLVDPEKG